MVSKLKKNLLYNTIYQLLNIALPLITVPYISRTLGVEQNGIYSYTYSIVNYFMIFAMLGISNYGNRRIAKVRDNKEKLSTEFMSIYALQALLSIISILFYGIYCAFFSKYPTISWIETLFLMSTLLDISWLYFGLENFKKTVTRNTIVKIVSIILILVLVKNSGSIFIYTLIMGASALFSQIVLWYNIKQYISFGYYKLTIKKTFSHLKGILILFIPVISYSVYKIMDKIMLGALYSIDEVAFYEYAEKLIGIPIGLITAIGTVMLPRMSNLVEKKANRDIMSYIYKSLRFIMFMTIPCFFGLIAISKNFSVIFLGEEYAPTGTIAQFLSVTIIFTAWANIVRTQWLIPNEKDRVYIGTTIIGAVINFIINLILIPKIGGIGAAIGTICSEFLIMFSQSFLSRKSIQFKKVFKQICFFLLTGAVMLFVITAIDRIINDRVMSIIAQISIGGILYVIMNLKFVKTLIRPANRK